MLNALRISLSALIVTVLPAGGSVAAAADLPRIILDVADTAVSAGGSQGWLTLYFSNYSDSVGGVEVRLIVDRPDLVWFDLANASYDTVGTLLSGFELVSARDSAGQSVYRLLAMANLPFSGPETPPLPPQSGDVLVRVPFSTTAQPDTTAGLTCNIDLLEPYVFSDGLGYAIGMVVVDTVPDTLFYRCTSWEGDSCLAWAQIDPDTSAWDSLYIYDYYVQELDTTQVVMVSGSITVLPAESLMCDFNDDGSYSISDLTCMIDFLFRGGGCTLVYCDCDSSGNDPAQPNIADLTCMVAFLFRGGTPPGH